VTRETTCSSHVCAAPPPPLPCILQVLEAIAKGRIDFAATLQQRGFLPPWYSAHLRDMQQQGAAVATAAAADSSAAVYGVDAVSVGGPDEFSHNSRIIKAAVAAGGAAVGGRGGGGSYWTLVVSAL